MTAAFTLTAAAAATAAGVARPLPSDVAALIGQSAGVGDLGA